MKSKVNSVVNSKVNKKKLIQKSIIKGKLNNAKIAKKFDVSKSYVSQLKKSLTETKFSKRITKKQHAPLTTRGFEGKADVITDDTTGDKKIKISHASGPLFGNQIAITSSVLGYDAPYDKQVVENWEPNMFLSVMDDNTGHALSAAQINSRRQENWIPTYFANPMQELDYITFEALSRSTIGGSIFQSIVKFLVGTGFRPELELINPGDDSVKNQKEIDANKEVIQNLLLIDQQLTVDGKGYLDVSFIEKISAIILNTLIFNRSALIFGYEKPIEINGTLYSDIPSSIKFAHARDLGIIKVSPGTHRLEAVQWINAFDMIPTSEMIYLWNPLVSSKTRNSWFYGDSMMLPMIDALRVIRKNLGVNFLAMAETSYAGRGLLSIAPQGSTEQEKIDEYTQITKNLSIPATTHLLLEDPENTRFDNINYQAKSKEFAELNESLVKYSVATSGMPHSMFYDESASNRATLIGKIQLAIATVINPMRESFGRTISDQWYDRWFRLIYKDDIELLKKFHIKMVFDDLPITEWFDNVEAALELDSRKQLKDSKFGELTGLSNYSDMVETDAETNPGGNSKNSMEIGGQKLTIKDKKSNLDKTKAAI
ncbi:MAG: hypothetical protein QQN44_05705 [Nitrosopumilus sp.]